MPIRRRLRTPRAVLAGSAVLCLALTLPSCAPNEGSEAGMASQGEVPPPTVVEKSPLTLEWVDLAKSNSESDLETLGRRLDDDALLEQLDNPNDYVALEAESLQVYFVLAALAANPHPSARKVVGELAASPRYGYPGALQAALLEASVAAADPAPGLVELWRRELAPDASELMRTVDVLVANGSAEALTLLEQALIANEYREDYVAAWFRDPVLRHRQDPHLLQMCQRLIANPDWPRRLKQHLVAALFDYLPDAWYQIDVPPPTPPQRDAMTDEARATLQAIAGMAREQRLIGGRRYREIRAELQSG